MINLKRLCRNCGAAFTADNIQQKYCCYECKMEASYREKRLAFQHKKDTVRVSNSTVCDTLAGLQQVLLRHGYRLSVGTLSNAMRYSSEKFQDNYGVYNIPVVLRFAQEHFARFKVSEDNDTGSKSKSKSESVLEEE